MLPTSPSNKQFVNLNKYGEHYIRMYTHTYVRTYYIHASSQISRDNVPVTIQKQLDEQSGVATQVINGLCIR